MSYLPYTDRQVIVYRELGNNKVDYVLVGALASMFHGRDRATEDIDILISKEIENLIKMEKVLDNLGFGVEGVVELFKKYKRVRIVGDLILDIHTYCGNKRFEDVKHEKHTYEGVSINVSSKEDLLNMMEPYRKNSHDVKVLKLFEDVVKNKEEIERLQ